MDYVFKKENGVSYNLAKSFQLNAPYNICFLLACAVIGAINENVSRAVMVGAITFFIWAYVIHVLSHRRPFTAFHGLHHTDDINERWWAELIEACVNLVGVGGIPLAIGLCAQRVLGCELLDYHVVLFSAVVYTSYHMINYHVLDVPTHIHHHRTPTANFGPDISDILFGTKMDGDRFEDMNHGILNIVAALVFVKLTHGTLIDALRWMGSQCP